MSKISNAAVLITGCSSGIGRCVAQGLKQRGYRVFATARADADVKALLEEGFEDASQLDLADSSSIRRATEEVLAATDGQLYGLFNNGGYGQPGAVEDLSRDTLRAQFETNVFGLQELTNLVLPAMRVAGAGRIIQNSSVLGFVSLCYRGAYNASKHALEALSDSLRMELSGTDIHVSLIEPGPVTSRFRQNAHAAFKRNIDLVNSAHRDIYAQVDRRLADDDKEVPFTLPAEAVLKKVIHALESPRPRVRYYVTVPTYAFAFLKRVLTHRALDRVLLGVAGRENPSR